MNFENKTLEETLAVSTNNTKKIDLPRDRFVRKLDLRFKFVIANGDAGAAHSFGGVDVTNLIKAIRVVANGKDTYVNLQGTRLYEMLHALYGAYPLRTASTSIAASSNATFYVNLPIDFAVEAANEWDVMASIPAQLQSAFQLFVDYGTPADVNANFTITEASSSCTVTVKEINMTTQEMAQVYGGRLEKLRKVTLSEVEKTIDATYTDYKFKIDLDTGALIQKLGIFSYDNTTVPVLVDTRVSAYKIHQYSPVEQDLDRVDWGVSQDEDRMQYKLEAVTTGFTMYDAEWQMGAGLDTRGLKTGDVRFQANISTGNGKVVLVHREVY